MDENRMMVAALILAASVVGKDIDSAVIGEGSAKDPSRLVDPAVKLADALLERLKV
jgi:hypothetical protein